MEREDQFCVVITRASIHSLYVLSRPIVWLTNPPGIFPMNVIIDRSACVSCGACWNTCPELFDQNPCDLFSQVAEEYRFNGDRAEGVVPDVLCQCAWEAADLCPVQVIQIA